MAQQRLKVAFLLPAFVAGGAERVMITLMNSLDRKIFAPILIAVRDEGPLRSLVAADIPVHVLGKKSVLKSIPALAKKLRQIRPDIAISTMALTNFALLIVKHIALPATPLVVREAITPSYILEKHKKFAPLIRTAYRFLYAQADMVIAPAQVIVDEFKNDLNMDTRRYVVLPNPVDTSRMQDLPERAPSKEVRFIAAGRLLPQKGFDRLIPAMETLPHKDWKLTILGDGPQKNALRALIKTPQISLPGHSDAPWKEMAAADAFLLPSRSEGLPNVALEALACGTKVIAMSEAGGIAEIAKLAPQGAVKIAKNMKEFVALMAEVKPLEGPQPSLLPPEYEMDNVTKRFADLLLNDL
jgi:glycosyltransferase involved in cell wall biosynthesis